MPDDRRNDRRAHVAAVRATYESATGERKETDVSDLSRGGLFLKTEAPLGVGKRVSIEIQIFGETSSWPALGRVIWNRASEEDAARPAGMAVKFIDIEESVAAAIDRLVQTREPTHRGVGARRSSPGDKTLLGVGVAAAPEAPPAAIAGETVFVAEPGTPPARAEPTPDPSLAIDLVARKSDPALARDGLDVPGASAVPGASPSTTGSADRPLARLSPAALEERTPRAAGAAPVGTTPAISTDALDAFSPLGAQAPRGAGSAPRAAVRAVAADPAMGTPAVSHRPSEASTDRTRDTERPARRRGRGGRLLGMWLILAGAAAAAVYVFRDTIAAWWAQIAPAVHRLLGQ